MRLYPIFAKQPLAYLQTPPSYLGRGWRLGLTIQYHTLATSVLFISFEN